MSESKTRSVNRLHPANRNIVLKVSNYQSDATRGGCYPGMVIGEIMGGPSNGNPAEVMIRETPTNGKSRKVIDFMDKEGHAYVPPGGYISLSVDQKSDTLMIAGWATFLALSDAEMRIGLPIQIAPIRDSEGNNKVYQSNGATLYRASLLHMPVAETTNCQAKLYNSITECYANNMGAFLTLTHVSKARNFIRNSFVTWRGWKDGAPRPIDEAVLNTFSEPNHSHFEHVLQNGGKIDVIPLESLNVGPMSAESIDRGYKSNINIGSYSTGGIGSRIETALRQSDQSNAAAVNRAFMAGLHRGAKTAFAENGWRGVWNSDIKRFFNGLGIEVPAVPNMGYSVSTAVLRAFPDKKGEQREFFLAKSRSLGPAIPLNSVATPSDPEAVKRYYDEFRNIVNNAADLILNGIEKKHAPEPAIKINNMISHGPDSHIYNHSALPEPNVATNNSNMNDQAEPTPDEQIRI